MFDAKLVKRLEYLRKITLTAEFMCAKKGVLIGVGSNLNEKLENIIQALETLKTTEGVKFIDTSSIYWSEALGFKGDAFYNLVWYFETKKKPIELLEICKRIEFSLGRKPKSRNQEYTSRTIDLDILFFEETKIESETLIVPHPEVLNRSFTTLPLLEVINNSSIRWLETKGLKPVLGAKILENETSQYKRRINWL